jgi:hypothetical protein
MSSKRKEIREHDFAATFIYSTRHDIYFGITLFIILKPLNYLQPKVVAVANLSSVTYTPIREYTGIQYIFTWMH